MKKTQPYWDKRSHKAESAEGACGAEAGAGPALRIERKLAEKSRQAQRAAARTLKRWLSNV